MENRTAEILYHRRGPQERGANVPLGSLANWLSALGGGGLALYGLRRRSLPGAALAATGGYLAYYGVLGLTGREQHMPWPVEIQRAFTINRPVEDCYRYWRDLENLPSFMRHLESVRVLDQRQSHWVARGPLGLRVEWDAEITSEAENERLAWRSLAGSMIENRGEVSFRAAPAGRGTEVQVRLEYRPPAGKPGRALAMFLGEEPEQQVREDLRHFKQIMEAGEIPTIQGQPSGRRGARGNLLQLLFHEQEKARRAG